MAKFIDSTGLTSLWNKIKASFAPLTGSFSFTGNNGAKITITHTNYSSYIELIDKTSRVLFNSSGITLYHKEESESKWRYIGAFDNNGLSISYSECDGAYIQIDNYNGGSYALNVRKAVELGIFEEL